MQIDGRAVPERGRRSGTGAGEDDAVQVPPHQIATPGAQFVVSLDHRDGRTCSSVTSLDAQRRQRECCDGRTRDAGRHGSSVDAQEVGSALVRCFGGDAHRAETRDTQLGDTGRHGEFALAIPLVRRDDSYGADRETERASGEGRERDRDGDRTVTHGAVGNRRNVDESRFSGLVANLEARRDRVPAIRHDLECEAVQGPRRGRRDRHRLAHHLDERCDPRGRGVLVDGGGGTIARRARQTSRCVHHHVAPVAEGAVDDVVGRCTREPSLRTDAEGARGRYQDLPTHRPFGVPPRRYRDHPLPAHGEREWMRPGPGRNVPHEVRWQDRHFPDPHRTWRAVALQADLGETDLVNAAVTL